MSAAKIISEMRPGGILRDEIKALIQNNGAYIIVSSSGSTSNTALKNRLDAMHVAVADEVNPQNLDLDFFDRTRIATWAPKPPIFDIMGAKENWASICGMASL